MPAAVPAFQGFRLAITTPRIGTRQNLRMSSALNWSTAMNPMLLIRVTHVLISDSIASTSTSNLMRLKTQSCPFQQQRSTERFRYVNLSRLSIPIVGSIPGDVHPYSSDASMGRSIRLAGRLSNDSTSPLPSVRIVFQGGQQPWS